MKRILITLSVALLFLGVARPANAAFIINALQVGPDVVFSGSGSIDLTAWTPHGPQSNGDSFFIQPDVAGIFFAFSMFDYYSAPANYSGPSHFGLAGDTEYANFGAGDVFGFQNTSELLGVPVGYQSGDPLSASMTFSNQTFTTLEINPGSYIWSWGSGATADYIRLNVGPLSVPESGSTLLMLGMVVAGYAVRRFWK
ncbi:MAG TPA: hypothetical protein VHW03_04385 [Chthoniobacterales bacterium]|nr:hypothetical protein [Chthoniobacterales bacterium]